MEIIKQGQENRKKSVERPQNKNLKRDAGPGRPVGQRNYATIYKEALRKLADKAGMTADELEDEIDMKALTLARKGDYRFYKDIKDRLHGLPKQSIDHTTGGKELPTPIMQITRIANTGGINNAIQPNLSDTENI